MSSQLPAGYEIVETLTAQHRKAPYGLLVQNKNGTWVRFLHWCETLDAAKTYAQPVAQLQHGKRLWVEANKHLGNGYRILPAGTDVAPLLATDKLAFFCDCVDGVPGWQEVYNGKIDPHYTQYFYAMRDLGA